MEKRSLIILVTLILILSIVAIFLFYQADKKHNLTRASSKGSGLKLADTFFPIGKNKVASSSPLDIFRFNATSVAVTATPNTPDYRKLTLLVNSAIAGGTSLDGQSSVLYQSTNGKILRLDLDNRTSTTLAEASNNQIYETIWGKDGQRMRLISIAIKDNVLGITSSLIGEQVESSDQSNTAYSIVSSPSKDKIFYFETSGGMTKGYTAGFDFTGKKLVFSSPFSEWRATWPEKNTILLVTKASAQVEGYAYILKLDSGKQSKLLGNKLGLTAMMSPGGDKLLYSESRGGDIGSAIVNTGSHKIQNLSLRILPEKCIWSRDNTSIFCAVPNTFPANDYPDAWYRGEVSFNDSLWKINASTGETTLLNNPDLGIGKKLDAIKLFLDYKEEALYFVDKTTGNLWQLDLLYNY